ncbi:hypothetical protein O181_101420 [Austropuccinia psidii MF-1]|uniref:Uncharacterized protein n=1 Tax=Austropuccinia psidii MF-1 TaxID=1389203 RepID=A0A9Q3JEE7_9BASI|nr:hypothetical protein [Austropuccinia psidii MF-1]
MQDILTTQRQKKGQRRVSKSYTPGGNPSEPTLPRHVRPEESPSSPTPGPRAASTPATEPSLQRNKRGAFFSAPTYPSPLQHQILRRERQVVKIKAKYYNLNLNLEEVKKFISKVERMAQIEGSREEDLLMEMSFWTSDSKISDDVEAIPGYEEGSWNQLKKDLIHKWGRVDRERRYKKESLINVLNDTQDAGGISTLSQYKGFIGEYETIITYLLRYKYMPQDNMFHEDFFGFLYAEIEGAIINHTTNEDLEEVH